jgi:PKD repeat protein
MTNPRDRFTASTALKTALVCACLALAAGSNTARADTVLWTFAFSPPKYTPGGQVTVTISVTQVQGGMYVKVEDVLPAGWTVEASTITPPSGTVTGTDRKHVTWNVPLAVPNTQVFQYKATASSCGPQEFDGTITLSNDTQALGQASLERGIFCTVQTCCTLACDAVASPTTGTAPLNVTFTGSATPSNCTGTVAYDWDFGDATHSSQPSPGHTYTAAGTYTWHMTASVAGVSCTRSGAISVSSGCGSPPAPALSTPATAGSGAAYVLTWTSTSPDNTYELQESTDPSFSGAASTAVTGTTRSTSHTVTSAATWYARVRAVESCQGSSYQSTWSNVAQTVVSPACALTCSASAAPTTGTAPLAVVFTGSATPTNCTGTVAYDWSFGDGSAHSPASNPGHTYSTGGTFTWTMVASVGGQTCSRTGTVSVSATPPIASAGTYLSVVAAAARAGGTAGSNWVSDLLLHNPGAGQATVNLYFMKGGQDNSAAQGRRLVVPSGQSLKLANVVGDTFGESAASGALLVGSDLPLVITSRTYNNASTGTYGQYIEGYVLQRAVTAGAEVRLIQLTKNTGYRTNIGLANATGAPLAVQVDLYKADGTGLGQRSYTVQPWGYFQENDILNKVTTAAVDDAYAVVRSATAGAHYFTYASVIDNRTGDPVQVVHQARRSHASQAAAPPGAGASRQGGER